MQKNLFPRPIYEEPFESTLDRGKQSMLERMILLQSMRQRIAELEVSIAKHILKVAQDNLENARKDLNLQTRVVVKKRDSLNKHYTLTPVSARQICEWRQQVDGLLNSLALRSQEINKFQINTEQALIDLDSRIARRRLIRLRKEKYTVMCDSLDEE